MTQSLKEIGIQIKEYRHGAWSGEFPTIIVAVLSGITGGMLGAIGKDIWEVLKNRLWNLSITLRHWLKEFSVATPRSLPISAG